eukprot:g67.t1
MASAVAWLKDRLAEGISLNGDSFDEMYERYDVVRAGALTATQGNKTQIDNFFSEEVPKGSALFFYIASANDAASGEKKDGSELKGGEPRALRCFLAEGDLTDIENAHGSSMFFLKILDGPVNETNMAHAVDFGVLCGTTLSNLHDVFREIYVPVIMDAPSVATSDVADGVESIMADSGRSGPDNGFNKFSSQLSQTLQQVDGDLQLMIPDVTIADPGQASEDFELVNQLEGALEEWTKVIASVVEYEGRKQVQGDGPLAEIEFWRERNAALSSLFEQIRMPHVQQMIKVLELVEANMIASFHYHFSELSKLCVEAKDNVKFLTTLERHFKNIASGNLNSIQETLPSMMNAIRMVWIISRHFNTDERMVPLMERIANEIASKVARVIRVPQILQKSADVAIRTINEAQSVLQSWENQYRDVRDRIEKSGNDHRWEFDKKRLFEKTNHMANICGDLSTIAQVLDEFHRFLGPELKTIIVDSVGIDDVLKKVRDLVEPLENMAFDIFDRDYKASWDAVMFKFKEKVIDLEEDTKNLIDSSFQKLRSAEGAFNLLQKFQNIQSRESIHKQMMDKFDDILSQYSNEVEQVRLLFVKDQWSPPIYKNYPPVAGAIYWAVSLYHRVKKPIMRFRTMEGLLKSDKGEEIKDQYLELARAIDRYIKELFNRWHSLVGQTCGDCLKQSILGPPIHRSHGNHGEKIRFPKPPFHVNFSPRLSMLIRESKYLDRMGFEIPETALNVTLQENKYHMYVQHLNMMLRRFDRTIADLSRVEKKLLVRPLKKLNETLYRGFEPLNWNSLHIPTYYDLCNNALNEFQTIVGQVRKSSTMIEEVVRAIAELKLIEVTDLPKGRILEISEVSEIVEKNRISRLSKVVDRYASIGPHLQKVEEIVAGTNTGSSPLLAEYYLYWERRVFNAITTMIMTSMAIFQGLLNIYHPKGRQGGTSGRAVKPPICVIKASMNAPDVHVSPSLNDVTRALRKMSHHIVVSAKAFKRWKRGSCVPCEPQVINDEEEPFVYSFYSDVETNPQIIKMLLTLTHCIQQVFNLVNAYLRSWKRYNDNYHLWDSKYRGKLDKLAEKDPKCVYFDTWLSIYSKLRDIVRGQPPEKDIDFIRIDSSPVIAAINERSTQWIDDYGHILADLSRQKLLKLNEQIDTLKEHVDTEISGIDSLKFVLNAVSSLSDVSLDVELDIADIRERYRTIRRYQVHTLEADSALADGFVGYYDSKADAVSAYDRAMKKIVPDDHPGKDLMMAKPKDSKAVAVAAAADAGKEGKDATTSAQQLVVPDKAVKLNRDFNKWEASISYSINDKWYDLYLWGKTRDLRLVKDKDNFRDETAQNVKDFAAHLKVVIRSFEKDGPGSAFVELEDGLRLMAEYHKKLGEDTRKRETLVNAEKLFNLTYYADHGYPELAELRHALTKLDKIYGYFTEFSAFVTNLSTTLWAQLDIPTMNRGVDDFEKRLRKFAAELKQLPTYSKVADRVASFKDSIPLIASLKNEALRPRHWKKLMEVTGVVFEMDPKKFTLDNLFAMNLHRFNAEIDQITTEALQELKIETALSAIENKWKETNFELMRYPVDESLPAKGIVLCSADDIKLELEDNMLNLQTMGGSRFAVIYMDQIRNWEKKLNHIMDCIEIWFRVQSKWMYLESIFIGAEDIRQQLPEEAKKFDKIDKAWKTIQTSTSKEPNVAKATHADNRIETLDALHDRLDSCQKSLTAYLDTKKNAFPRFFFISEDELLSILGTSDPTAIQQHLLKLYSNCKEFAFGRGNSTVTGMTSSEGESYKFVEPAHIEGAVEVWMETVEKEMHNSLHTITKEGVFNYAKMSRPEWIDKQLGQVCLLGSRIWWTWETEDTFRKVADGDIYAMKDFLDRQNAQLQELVNTVRKKIRKDFRKKINVLLIIDVHAKNIIDMFVRDSINDKREFEWESQLRFYWDRKADDALIQQCTGSFNYGYEYLGRAGCLVITPLTDRCYMTLTQALTFNLGGSPAGPAGTGKTETVKDLSKALGLPCFVINCGEGLDYRAMGNIFSGLCQIGAWGCFDEFNRINIEVLSVVAAQIFAIQTSLNYGREKADLSLGSEITVKRSVGIFITMNPGYAGRTELPDNLKALFRPVTMIVPDLMGICEIWLFSEGFSGANVLAKKMTTLYSLAEAQLSKQYHYDFKLRALKSVLVKAGGLKRENEGMPEDVVLFRALRDMNNPKFVFEDVPLFLGLLGDLFPGLDVPRVSYVALKDAIERDLEEKNMRHSDEVVFQLQVDKIIQLYETFLVRHTTMIVGPTGGGKTTALKCLQRSMLPAFDQSVKIFTLNPKAQTLAELYGTLDPVTRDWTDGILTKLFRDMNMPLPQGKENERRWLVYDGDVDALWIENMNSVMDDNRLLTMANGERIRLETYSMMIMETFDLQYASPATISRCGMVWVDPKNLGYRPFFEYWVHNRCIDGREEDKEILLDLFDKYVDFLIAFVLEGLVDGELEERPKLVIPLKNVNMVKQLCSLYDSLLPVDLESEDPLERDDMEGVFLYCVLWSIGGALVGADRGRFDMILRKVAELSLPQSSMYENFFDLKTSSWEPWSKQVPAYEPPVPFEFSSILVPTTDNVLYAELLRTTMRIKKPCLFVGEPGTAKTVTIQHYLGGLDRESNMVLTINMSSRTNANDVRTSVNDVVDKKTGKTYGPPTGKMLTVFIDDMNMPKVDTYGTQQPIALLHFLVGRGNMYSNEKDLELRNYKDMLWVGAMGPPDGGRNPTDPRFVSLFNVFNLTPPSGEVLNMIYSSILTGYLGPFNADIADMGGKLTPFMMRLYNHIIESLPATPAKFHYIFNLRDLSKTYEGLCLATPDEFETPSQFLRLWRNECLRVFRDRMTTVDDQKVVNDELDAIIGEMAPESKDEIMADPSIFGDFEHAPKRISEDAEDPKLYKDLQNHKAIKRIFDDILESYNIDMRPMNLVMFDMALEHIMRIHRIIRLPRGNALLIGVGGSGRQSLTKLGSFCAGYDIFEITLSRGYGESDFREDLKELYSRAIKGPIVFLFTDAHCIEEGFLENVNNMLTAGMVPALFASDEKDTLCNGLRDKAAELGIIGTSENLWQLFLSITRKNLHIVLSMSPSGDTLRVRCRNFPGLVSNTTIDWFFKWPEDALSKVAEHFLADEGRIPDEQREHIVSHMVTVHRSIEDYSLRFMQELRRTNTVTPKHYLDYISGYRGQLKTKNNDITASIKRLTGGLEKLKEAAIQVDKMKIELSDAKKIVDAKVIEVNANRADIEAKQEVAGVQETAAAKKSAELEEQGKLIAIESAKANDALEAALPALAMAAEALKGLDPKMIGELRQFKVPPAAVQDVCACVLALKPIPGLPASGDWDTAKKMLADTKVGFLKSLKNYNKDNITGRMVTAVKKYFKNPKFTVDEIRSKTSVAAANVLQWVVAVVGYYEVAKDVAPLKAKVAGMEKEAYEGNLELTETKKQLAALEAQLAELSKNFKIANDEKTRLEDEAALMEKRLSAAEALITGLASERERWSNDAAELRESKTRLVGDCVLAASFMSYLGPFTFQYRSEMLGGWVEDVLSKEVPTTKPFSVRDMLVTDGIVKQWGAEQLPGDDHSVQNGILTTQASRFPLCIDPQTQAVRWIKNHEASSKLVVRQLNDSDFMKHLELAVQFGNPFLFENVMEELDPMIDPILEKNTFMQGSARMIKLGDKVVDWDSEFRLYLTSKLANPKYTPEIMGKVMIINYSVTMSGLAAQLLNDVVGHERKDLEEQFRALVDEMSANAVLQIQLEDNLLAELASSSGNILDNDELIATLAETKKKAVEISQRLEEANFTKQEIERSRQSYLPVAERGSVCFFTMSSLTLISKMYETSLGSFLTVFMGALDDAKKDAVFKNRISNMINSITAKCYDYTCTGIFEKHKLMFSFQLCTQIMELAGDLNRPELDFFLKGNTALVRCFRVDRCYNAVQEYVSQKMGDKYVQPPMLDYKKVHAQSTPTMPMIFILSPGADPASDIQSLAESKGIIGNHFKAISLGQGQGPKAIRDLETGSSRGHWVLLQNCHLLLSWLSQLEVTLDNLATKKLHENFRLWLTTDPTDKFPLGILQRSLKVVTEPPVGLKLNVRSTMFKMTPEQFEEECAHEAYRPLVYVLAFFHAIVQDRRKYGKLGWNVAYDFNESDFNISRRLVALYLTKALDNGDEMIPWGSLKYLVGDAMYGGRVSDDFDRRVLRTYIDEYMGDFLFETTRHFYLSQQGFDYDVPEWGPLAAAQEHVESMPLVSKPAVFGLHPNAEIGYLTLSSKAMMRNLIELQPRSGGAGTGISREDFVDSICVSISEKVPETVDLMILRKEIGTPTPTQVVLLQELERWNLLCSSMTHSLHDLRRALKGEMGMSDKLDALMDGLFNGFLPGSWQALAPKSEKPLGSWISHFEHRHDQYEEWLDPDRGEPAVMWLSGLHIPDSYLTALVQTTCRARGWPLDKSVMYSTVTKFTDKGEVAVKLESGCYVMGLTLEGAAWDLEKSVLVKQRPKVLSQPLPLLQVIPIEASKLKLQNTLRTPVYVTSQRRNAMGVGLVFEADLATHEHPSHWVLMGVALILNTDD